MPKTKPGTVDWVIDYQTEHNPLNKIIELLKLQKEVKYLTWAVLVDPKTSKLKIELDTMGINKKIVGTEEECLTKVIDALFQLKTKEAWMIRKLK